MRAAAPEWNALAAAQRSPFLTVEWLTAARNELKQAREELVHKRQRPGVAGARRAAGMAWNAVLTVVYDERFGRSYMDHLKTLSEEPSLAAAVREAAKLLLSAPLETNVIPIGKGDTQLADAAQMIIDSATAAIIPKVSA